MQLNYRNRKKKKNIWRILVAKHQKYTSSFLRKKNIADRLVSI